MPWWLSRTAHIVSTKNISTFCLQVQEIMQMIGLIFDVLLDLVLKVPSEKGVQGKMCRVIFLNSS